MAQHEITLALDSLERFIDPTPPSEALLQECTMLIRQIGATCLQSGGERFGTTLNDGARGIVATTPWLRVEGSDRRVAFEATYQAPEDDRRLAEDAEEALDA